MTPWQYAPTTDVEASSVHLHEEDAERPRSRGNVASQQFHHTLEEGPPRPSILGTGDTLRSGSSMPTSSVASNNLPENYSTSSNNSQSTAQTGTTPPTSLSAPSSQNHPPSNDRMNQLNTMSEVKTLSAQAGVHLRTVYPESQSNALRIHTTPTSPTTANFAVQTLGHGQKRTASGQTKPSSSSLPTSPVEEVGWRHSRNTSVNSGGTQIGELSLQLRTRLSYAMVKVQNGWQSHSLGEVENLAAQHVSPTSNPSTCHHHRRIQHSPERSILTPAKARNGFSRSPERDTEATRLQYHAAHEDMSVIPTTPTHPYRPPLNQQTSPSSTETPTYESFWRQHSARPTGEMNAQVKSTKPAGPSLEPPANIFSRNPRRTNPQQVHPTLYTKSLSNVSTSSETSGQSFIPATPPPTSQRRATTHRTPSQNAAMEKDAVETLLFMSSPVHPGYHPHSRNGPSPGTPVKTPNGVAAKRVGFAATGTDGSIGLESSDEEPRSLGLPKSRASRLHSGLGSIDKEDDIDRMLDAMDSSSDDEI